MLANERSNCAPPFGDDKAHVTGLELKCGRKANMRSRSIWED